MKYKDLNSLEFSALVRSLINYEIVLRLRDGRPKHGKAVKPSTHFQKEESERELTSNEEEDEKAKYYSTRIATYKNLLKNKKNQQKEMEQFKEKKEIRDYISFSSIHRGLSANSLPFGILGAP